MQLLMYKQYLINGRHIWFLDCSSFNDMILLGLGPTLGAQDPFYVIIFYELLHFCNFIREYCFLCRINWFFFNIFSLHNS